jgi:3-deoxy-manno-octulosonate cytidylyltransferase (CMP-KDO synthetase)
MASTRLPNKPLVDICGKPMIQKVWENVSTCRLVDRIFVATDDVRIYEACAGFGADCILTSAELPSGTDRIMKAYEISGENADVVVNVQGDEPLLSGSIIDELLENFIRTDFDVGTLITEIKSPEDLLNDSVVKVELNENMTAKCFSRKPVPEIENVPVENWLSMKKYYKHIGIYAYKIDALRKFVSLPVSAWEREEKLEQLRLLETGAKYFCVETNAFLIGVDTQDDLEKVRNYLQNQ